MPSIPYTQNLPLVLYLCCHYYNMVWMWWHQQQRVWLEYCSLTVSTASLDCGIILYMKLTKIKQSEETYDPSIGLKRSFFFFFTHIPTVTGCGFCWAEIRNNLWKNISWSCVFADSVVKKPVDGKEVLNHQEDSVNPQVCFPLVLPA